MPTLKLAQNHRRAVRAAKCPILDFSFLFPTEPRRDKCTEVRSGLAKDERRIKEAEEGGARPGSSWYSTAMSTETGGTELPTTMADDWTGVVMPAARSTLPWESKVTAH